MSSQVLRDRSTAEESQEMASNTFDFPDAFGPYIPAIDTARSAMVPNL
jgi:hypothetical protein